MAFNGWFRELFIKPCPILLIFLFTTIIVKIDYGAMVFVAYTNETEILSQFKTQLPELKQYANELSIYCFENSPRTQLFSLSIGCVILGFFVLGNSCFAHFYYVLRKTKKLSYDRTVKLQIMLFKALGVQLLVGYVFLLFPVVVIYFGFYFQHKNMAFVSSICLMFMCVHGIADYLTMVVFIAPYRRALFKKVMVLFGKWDPRKINGSSYATNNTVTNTAHVTNLSQISPKNFF